jgi:hypothetical protein
MPKWQIRVQVPPGPAGFRALEAALAGFDAGELLLARRGVADDELTADLVVGLRDDDELGELLPALHAISPQVFISRVRQPEPNAPRRGRAVRVRKLRAAASLVR